MGEEVSLRKLRQRAAYAIAIFSDHLIDQMNIKHILRIQYESWSYTLIGRDNVEQ